MTIFIIVCTCINMCSVHTLLAHRGPAVQSCSGGAVSRATDALLRLPPPESSVHPPGPGHQVPNRGEPSSSTQGGAGPAQCCESIHH